MPPPRGGDAGEREHRGGRQRGVPDQVAGGHRVGALAQRTAGGEERPLAEQARQQPGARDGGARRHPAQAASPRPHGRSRRADRRRAPAHTAPTAKNVGAAAVGRPVLPAPSATTAASRTVTAHAASSLRATLTDGRVVRRGDMGRARATTNAARRSRGNRAHVVARTIRTSEACATPGRPQVRARERPMSLGNGRQRPSRALRRRRRGRGHRRRGALRGARRVAGRAGGTARHGTHRRAGTGGRPAVRARRRRRRSRLDRVRDRQGAARRRRRSSPRSTG